MPSTTTTLFRRIAAVQRDHTALLEIVSKLRELQATLSKLREGAPIQPLYLVQDFALELYEHFGSEENDSYFGTLVSERPSLAPRVESLRSDHAQIVRSLANIPVRAASGISGLELSNLLGAALDLLQAHEQRENALMQDYLLRDEGVPGE